MEWHWYLICTKPAQEQWVAAQLSTLIDNETILDSYCPLEKRRSGRNVRIYPFFKGYIFLLANLNDGDALDRVRRVPRIATIPKLNSQYLYVDNAEIQFISSREGEDGLIDLSYKPPVVNNRMAILPNQRVKVEDKSSLYYGMEGIFDKHLREANRISVLLEAANYKFKVDLHVTNIAFISGEESGREKRV
jgi:transcription antitermination factor NusG